MARQQELKGMERKRVKEIDYAAEAYVKARDTRMKHTVKEKEAKVALVVVMKKHKLDVYKDIEANPPLTVYLAEGETGVKVVREESDEEAAEALKG